MSDIEGSPTATMSRYISTARYNVLPVTVIDAAKTLVLDCIGNMIAGERIQAGRDILELVQWLGGNPQATIVANGYGANTVMAAYANSSLANLLDFDDFYGTQGHLGATAIPPALALAEYLKANGRDLLTAIVVGYEVAGRVGEYMQPSSERYKKVTGFSTWQTFGAAAATASLLELDGTQVRHALGIAGLGAPVPNVRKLGLEVNDSPVSWTKNNYGIASLNGTIASWLASRGFVGNAQIFDGDSGFWRMAGSDRHQPDCLVAGLNESFVSLKVGLKPYACCRWTHAAVEAAEALANQGISGDDVKNVTVESFYEASASLGRSDPSDVVAAQFSLPTLVALVLYGRSPAGGMSETDLQCRSVRDLAERTKVRVSDTADQLFFGEGRISAEVILETEDGHSYRERVVDPLGDPARPLGRIAVEEKFVRLAGSVLGEERARRVRDEIGRLDECTDVRSLVRGWFD